MPTLQQQLQALASSFAHDVLAAMRGASLEDLVAESSHGGTATSRAPGAAKRSARTKAAATQVPVATTRAPRTGKGGRLWRRSPEEIEAVVGKIAALLKTKKDGLRAEQIQAALGLTRKELPKPLAAGLAEKTLKKKGKKRATIYYAA